MHAWRSDAVLAINKRRAEEHGDELRAKDASRKHLEEEIGELRRMAEVRDQDYMRITNNSGDELAARVVLLQELQKRTENEHARELASLRLELEQQKTASSLRTDTDLEATFPLDIQAMSSSMAALQERCSVQEDELKELRSRPPEDAELRTRLDMTQQKLSVAEVCIFQSGPVRSI